MGAGSRWESKPSPSENWRAWAEGDCEPEADIPVISLAFFTPEAEVSTEWEGFSPIEFYQPAIAIHVKGGAAQYWGTDEAELSSGAEAAPGIFSEAGAITVRSWNGDAYRERVERALVLLREGALEKVVIARRSTLRLAQPFDLQRALKAMLKQPHAFSICYSPDGKRFFLSATPERLGRIVAGQFETIALAGTIPRQGESDADTLLSDEKERKEHAYVVEMIRAAAESFAAEISIRDAQALELPHVRHIMTGISGKMRDGRGMRHVIAALHPTPAVAGTPRRDAQELIAELEPFSRGLYAGCIGWFSGNGEGDAAVTIRSALVRECEALVWAGAGIVKDSSAEAEELETRAKLQTMLDILGA